MVSTLYTIERVLNSAATLPLFGLPIKISQLKEAFQGGPYFYCAKKVQMKLFIAPKQNTLDFGLQRLYTKRCFLSSRHFPNGAFFYPDFAYALRKTNGFLSSHQRCSS